MAQDPSKTEQATPKRREKTREEGNVPKSQEVTKAITTICGAGGIALYIGVMVRHLQFVYGYFFSNAATLKVTTDSVHTIFIHAMLELTIILLPVLIFIALSAWISLRLQVGGLWTTKVFQPKWSKFNIIKGLKGMFMSAQTLVRLIRSIIQMIIIGMVPFFLIKAEFNHFIDLYYYRPEALGMYMLSTGFMIVLYTVMPMLVIAGADLWYTRYSYEENIKMSKDEVKDERKQTEGDPVIKQKQKQRMMQMMAKRMMQDVPKADVVITNPTHIAIALRYNPIEAPAPIILAMGVDHVAEKIKEIAREHGIPIRENVPLARALYNSAEVGDMIPEDLYKATASILASIWKLKGKKIN